MKNRNKFRTLFFLVSGLLIFTVGCKKTDVNPATKDESQTKVTDLDGNIYKTITIGTQVWMASDLKTTRYRNGDAIPTTTLDISAEASPKYQWAYGDNEANAAVYGRLYTWYAATDSRNVCPTGWHVPTDMDWETLKLFLGGESIAAGKLKEAGTTHWNTPNTGATNETNFTALPGGYRTMKGAYVSLQLSNYQWSSNEDALLSWGQSLHYDDNILLRGGYNRQAGVSVRCIKD